ncbi:hepatic lectin [Colossoma macropomum]|uniref:hepatic lectin n=1 Tax=Colossoma macropomum TaxID=42526 RepID=UPI0018641D45|nr:hepatic lectin [Colossoma macropomum]
MEVDDNMYSNVSPPSKPQSRDKSPGGSKRDGSRLVIAISVLLFLSLLTNAVLTYLYCKIKLAPCSSPLQMKKCSSEKLIEEEQVQVKDRLYVFSLNKMSWNSSRERCKELGGDLVIVNSKEEHEFLARMAAADLHWIGLTDAEDEGVWLWVDHTPLMKNLSWWAYPPDDWKAHNPLGEDCAVYYTGKWADVSCSSLEKRICEIPCPHDSY